MGNARRWAAAVLAMSVITSGMPGYVLTVSAEEEAAVGSAVVTEDQEGFKENSWRYEAGEVIPQAEAYAISEHAWKFYDGYFRNSAGNPIPNAKLKGIDVSEHQSTIDWDKVKADGVDYAILRCGYGNNYTSQDDKYWLRNVSECERLGIPYGVYIYSYARSVDQARSEAEHVLRLIKGRNLAYPVYYDMEDSSTISVGNAMLGQMAKTFCDTITNAGYATGIYANLNWWGSYLTDPVFNNSTWSKWVAQYNVTCDYNGAYDMWQSSSSAKVNGISGGVDVNFWVGEDENVKVHPFSDVDAGMWCHQAVTQMYKRGIMTGTSDNYFSPAETTIRAQFVTILNRLAGTPQAAYTPQFPDVPADTYYTNAVMWASSQKIVTGYENGCFGTADAITREQMIVMLYRYAAYKGYNMTAGSSLGRFPDGQQVSGFAVTPMQWAVEQGIITGNGDGTLAPGDVANRAACAMMIMRFMNWAGL